MLATNVQYTLRARIRLLEQENTHHTSELYKCRTAVMTLTEKHVEKEVMHSELQKHHNTLSEKHGNMTIVLKGLKSEHQHTVKQLSECKAQTIELEGNCKIHCDNSEQYQKMCVEYRDLCVELRQKLTQVSTTSGSRALEEKHSEVSKELEHTLLVNMELKSKQVKSSKLLLKRSNGLQLASETFENNIFASNNHSSSDNNNSSSSSSSSSSRETHTERERERERDV